MQFSRCRSEALSPSNKKMRKDMTIPYKTKVFKVNILVLVCSTAALCFNAAANGANVTAFGDSITVGQGSTTGGYPPKLSALLDSHSKPAVVVNSGRSGEYTTQGVKRIGGALASNATDIVLIMEGTNDVTLGISSETTRYNLQAMISSAKAAGATPVLATLTPSNRPGAATLIPDVWNPMIKNLASGNSIKLADQYAAIQSSWGTANTDGLHPNDSGYQIIASTWYKSVGSLITSSGEVDPTGSQSSDGGGGGGGCFIATAAFGSPVEKHVQLLKEFRDTFLLTNLSGRWLVEAYYLYSPPVADFISRHENVKLLVRVLLYPLIAFSYLLLKLSMPTQLTLAALTTVFCLVLSVFATRRRIG
jgi:lysophospholipase L1-like esterase